MAEVTYYFSSFDIGMGWTTAPEKMVDNILANHASTSSTGTSEWVDGNTCPGTDLGTITKVELRVYGYGDGDDKITLTPLFGGADLGDFKNTVPGVDPGWTAYVDITTGLNAPSPWTWPDVVGLDCRVTFVKVAKGNTMRCAKVEIRVTYEEAAPPGYPYHRRTLKGAGQPYSGRRGFDETTGHRRGFWPT